MQVLKRADEKWERWMKKQKVWNKKKKERQLSLKKHLTIQYAFDYTPILIKFNLS